MTDTRTVSCRPTAPRTLAYFIASGVLGAGVAAARFGYGAAFDDSWADLGLVLTVVGVPCVHLLGARVDADAEGLRSRTVLRRRSVAWRDIADLRVQVRKVRGTQVRRVRVVRHDGRTWRLPLPVSGNADDQVAFDAKLAALRALHRRHALGASATPLPGGVSGTAPVRVPSSGGA